MAAGKRHAIQLDLKQTVESESPLTLKPLPPSVLSYPHSIFEESSARKKRGVRQYYQT
jgi:hypothetical protein